MYKTKVIIIGGGFAGINAAKQLSGASSQVTLVDKRNFHLFQPLLYQVATGSLGAPEIASPLRAMFKKVKNVHVIQGEVIDIDFKKKEVFFNQQSLPYDFIVIATGQRAFYFKNPEWSENAPALKTIEDGMKMRTRILTSFEKAESETIPDEINKWLTFVIVGGGPTGVELAGAIRDLTLHALRHDFRTIDIAKLKIHLIEANEFLLPTFKKKSSISAQRILDKMEISVHTGCRVLKISGEKVIFEDKFRKSEELLYSKTILWAAGVQPSELVSLVAQKLNADTDRSGRIIVDKYLNVPGHNDVFIAGDIACVKTKEGSVPGMAPGAMQEGTYIAQNIIARLNNNLLIPDKYPFFKYRDKGNLAVIGRGKAILEYKNLVFSGFVAWIIWAFVHIFYLIGFENKIAVFFFWAWNYITNRHRARLILNE
jgi:NADH:ubiquinone reductase (H+-translocating)